MYRKTLYESAKEDGRNYYEYSRYLRDCFYLYFGQFHYVLVAISHSSINNYIEYPLTQPAFYTRVTV